MGAPGKPVPVRTRPLPFSSRPRPFRVRGLIILHPAEQYLDYDGLKKVIQGCTETEFMELLEAEQNKVDQFTRGQIAQLVNTLRYVPRWLVRSPWLYVCALLHARALPRSPLRSRARVRVLSISHVERHFPSSVCASRSPIFAPLFIEPDPQSPPLSFPGPTTTVSMNERLGTSRRVRLKRLGARSAQSTTSSF